MRQRLIGAGFAALGATGAHRWAAPALRGLGAILMFHHVRPYVARAFEPNRLLEIAPDFLERVIVHLRGLGYEIVPLGEAVARLRAPGRKRAPFAVLTFDDGYRDNLQFALPVLERHRAPFTTFITTGFADRTARLWWLELEEAIRRANRVEFPVGPDPGTLPCATAEEKAAAFAALYRQVRRGSEAQLRAVVGRLCALHGIDGREFVSDLCMDWGEVERLARHPLATVGAHTLTHPRLAKVDEATMRAEIEDGRRLLEARTGTSVRFFAYPVGDATSAGPREFAAVAANGFAAAVTTRPGLVYGAHADHLTALPRVSVNGRWQDLRYVDILLSGAAFALWNRGRRVHAA